MRETREAIGDVALSASSQLPTTDSDSPELHRKLKSSNSLASQWLNNWGPWKRFNLYRMNQKSRRPSRWKDRDVEDNEKSKLPDDEGLQLPAMWVAELYTPSTIPGLLEGIERLGWKYGTTRGHDLSKWMSDVREGRSAGWTSLGLVSSPDAKYVLTDRVAKLPAGVKGALPALMTLTPSLTAFVVVFIFDDDVASSLEQPLRKDYVTITRRNPRLRSWHVIRYILTGYPCSLGYSIHSPDLVRGEEVNKKLQALEDGCVRWVGKNLPGVFSTLPRSRVPIATLLITEKAKPASNEARAIGAFARLAISRDYDAWEISEWPGAKLVFPYRWEDEGSRLVFACRRNDAFPHESGYHDPDSNWTIAQRADDQIQGLLSRWAISCLLDGYHETLSTLRDGTASDGKYRVIRDLKNLRALTRTTLYDILACTPEIVEFTESDFSYRHNVAEPTYVREHVGKKEELLKNLRWSQAKRARQIEREANLLLTTLATSNNLSQTISGIRTQRVVVLLTLISIGVALWAALLTLHTFN